MAVVLYSDVSEDEAFNKKQPLLAHYTSIEALEKILASNEVWFSNPLFMNDLEEVRFGLFQGVPLATSNSEIDIAWKTNGRVEAFKYAFNHYFQEFANQHVMDTYVFCLSEHSRENHDGLLSMWRGYGGNGKGAAIVFDTSKLNVVPASPLIIAKVTYASTEGRISWLNKTLSKFAHIVAATHIPDQKIYLAANALFQRLKLFALFTKHQGFDEEREWRVVYLNDRDVNKTLEPMFNYFVGPLGVEPKLRFKIAPIAGLTADDLSLAKIVDRIILGPTISSPLSKAAVIRMLEKLGHSEFKDKVHASTIPFRASE